MLQTIIFSPKGFLTVFETPLNPQKTANIKSENFKTATFLSEYSIAASKAEDAVILNKGDSVEIIYTGSEDSRIIEAETLKIK